jgi:hypothetical protein
MRLALLLFVVSAGFAAGPQYTADGRLKRPQNYREWTFLTSGLGMSYASAPAGKENPDPGFGNVFVETAAYQQFVSTGKWPDKAVFVIENRNSATKGSIVKGGRFQAGPVTGMEVAVKDTTRFTEDGWGYFLFDAKSESARRLGPQSQCNSCHSQNGATDNTFVQFYPTLLEIARAKGVLKPSYLQGEAGH